MRRQMRRNLRSVKRIDTNTEMIHVAPLGRWRASAPATEFAVHPHKVDQRAPGTQLNQAERVLTALMRSTT